MAQINLGTDEKPEDYQTCVRHTPGWPAPPYMFTVGKGEEIFTANLIYPYGKNPKHNTPILAWIESNKKCYSPEYFFEKIICLGSIWKDKDQFCRFFTLYGVDESTVKTRIYKQVESDKFNDYPLACFKKEGNEESPVTFIKREANYGKFIYAISAGDLNESVRVLKESRDDILLAYPYLDILVNNLTKVYESEEALKWLNNIMESKIDEEKTEKIIINDFEGLNVFCKELFSRKRKEKRFENGIISIISKIFAYVPREL
jgi:hypothetical protein